MIEVEELPPLREECQSCKNPAATEIRVFSYPQLKYVTRLCRTCRTQLHNLLGAQQ